MKEDFDGLAEDVGEKPDFGVDDGPVSGFDLCDRSSRYVPRMNGALGCETLLSPALLHAGDQGLDSCAPSEARRFLLGEEPGY